jgi:hypothetical protein
MATARIQNKTTMGTTIKDNMRAVVLRFIEVRDISIHFANEST